MSYVVPDYNAAADRPPTTRRATQEKCKVGFGDGEILEMSAQIGAARFDKATVGSTT